MTPAPQIKPAAMQAEIDRLRHQVEQLEPIVQQVRIWRECSPEKRPSAQALAERIVALALARPPVRSLPVRCGTGE